MKDDHENEPKGCPFCYTDAQLADFANAIMSKIDKLRKRIGDLEDNLGNAHDEIAALQ